MYTVQRMERDVPQFSINETKLNIYKEILGLIGVTSAFFSLITLPGKLINFILNLLSNVSLLANGSITSLKKQFILLATFQTLLISSSEHYK